MPSLRGARALLPRRRILRIGRPLTANPHSPSSLRLRVRLAAAGAGPEDALLEVLFELTRFFACFGEEARRLVVVDVGGAARRGDGVRLTLPLHRLRGQLVESVFLQLAEERA